MLTNTYEETKIEKGKIGGARYNMKCPHCLENFFEEWEEKKIGSDEEGTWRIKYCTCPSCKKLIIKLEETHTSNRPPHSLLRREYLVRPKAISRAPLPPEVPEKFANDYKEACLVVTDSPKASAALSRRCLQNLLREKAGTTKKNLADQIQEVIDSNQLPSYLLEGLDAIRNIGNFAAHPIKSKSTGEIVEVEPGEAEWNLDILERLFDFYFVQPEILKKKREKLNQKLKDAGKPPMK